MWPSRRLPLRSIDGRHCCTLRSEVLCRTIYWCSVTVVVFNIRSSGRRSGVALYSSLSLSCVLLLFSFTVRATVDGV